MLTFHVDGTAVVINGLDRLEALLNVKPILDESAAVLLNKTRTRFLSEINPDGERWVVSGAAIKRARQGKGGGTLYASGRLFHSIQLYSSGEDNTRTIGTDVPYAKWLQYGTRNMVARQFLGFSEGDVSLVQAILKRLLTDAGNVF